MRFLEAQALKNAKQDRRGIEDKMLPGPAEDKATQSEPTSPVSGAAQPRRRAKRKITAEEAAESAHENSRTYRGGDAPKVAEEPTMEPTAEPPEPLSDASTEEPETP